MANDKKKVDVIVDAGSERFNQWLNDALGDVGQCDVNEAGMMALNFPSFTFYDPKHATAERKEQIDALMESREYTAGKVLPIFPGTARGGIYYGPMKITSDKFLNKEQIDEEDDQKRPYQNLHVFQDSARRVFGVWGTSALDGDLEKITKLPCKTMIQYMGKVPHNRVDRDTGKTTACKIHKHNLIVDELTFVSNLAKRVGPAQAERNALAAETARMALPQGSDEGQ